MKKLKDSFKFAFNGLKETLIFERNFKIMLFAALLMAGAVFYFDSTRTEKAVIFTAIFAVLTLELVNTAIERILDFLEPAHHEQVRIIKDLMAAVVMVACFGAVIIGLIVFWPHFR
ncbi:MAG: diacylglycerol kinase family protein [Candidatus Niyogibacteria bacterium]|nr:diacylglycerol kinase family protein [Candidatus Niyogibacteria bacterium]